MYKTVFTVQSRKGVKTYKHAIPADEVRSQKKMQDDMNKLIYETSKLIGHEGGLLRIPPSGNIFVTDDKLGEVKIDIQEVIGITAQIVKC